jgi:Response regulator containing CheY-like receiver domain and AraC-type DNA-binding domain
MTTTTPKPRVVVADDSALMRRIVTNVLTKGGIDVIGAARDGDEALALCERETPDAMTLDLAMPGLGGIDVLKALKQRGGPAIPVVVVSAFSPATAPTPSTRSPRVRLSWCPSRPARPTSVRSSRTC